MVLIRHDNAPDPTLVTYTTDIFSRPLRCCNTWDLLSPSGYVPEARQCDHRIRAIAEKDQKPAEAWTRSSKLVALNAYTAIKPIRVPLRLP